MLDPRPQAFLRAAASAIETIWLRPEVAPVSVGLNRLHDSLQMAAADIERTPAIAAEGRFFRLVADTAKTLSLAAEVLPDFRASSAYQDYL